MHGVWTTCNDQTYIYAHVCTALQRNFRLESPLPVRMTSRDGKEKDTCTDRSTAEEIKKWKEKESSRINYARGLQLLRNSGVVPNAGLPIARTSRQNASGGAEIN